MDRLVPSGKSEPVRCMVISVAPTDEMPDKGNGRDVQAAAAGNHATVPTRFGPATVDSEGLFRVDHRGRRVLWIPAKAEEPKKRLPVCAHMQDAGH